MADSTDWANNSWQKEEWNQADGLYSGGKKGRKWLRWFTSNFYYGFMAQRIDQESPTLTVPMPMLDHVGVRGLDPVIRFWTPEWPGKSWIWVIESITQRDESQMVFQVQQPTSEDNPQTWRLQAITEEQFKQLWDSGWDEWMA